MRKWNGAPTVSGAADVNSSFERSRHNLPTTPWGDLQVSNGIQRMHVTNSEKMAMSSIIWSCSGFSSRKEACAQRFDRTSAFLGA
jgi:hypothetical protein